MKRTSNPATRRIWLAIPVAPPVHLHRQAALHQTRQALVVVPGARES